MFKKTLFLLLQISFFASFAQTEVRETQSEESNDVFAPESAYEAPSGVAIFSENGKYGLKNYSTSQIVLAPDNDFIINKIKDYFEVMKNGKYGIYNSEVNKMVVPLIYEDAEINNELDGYEFINNKKFVIKITKNGKKGLLNSNFETILDTQYDLLETHKEYVRLGKNEKEGIYFFDHSKKNIPLECSNIIESYPSGSFIGIKEGLYNLYDSNGKLISSKNKEVTQFYDFWSENSSFDVLIKNNKNKFGIYNGKTKRIGIPINYENIPDYFQGNYIVKKNSKFGIVNAENKKVVTLDYDTISFMKPRSIESLILAKKTGKFGLINLKNQKITDFIYDDIEDINDRYKAKVDNKYYILDTNIGKKISDVGFNNVGSFYGGKAAIFNDGKIGYINFQGKIVEPIERKSEARGYKTLDEAFLKFVEVLKTKDDNLLMEFTKNISLDEYSTEFMERIGYVYRGFPTEMKTHNITFEKINAFYFDAFLNFRNKLDKRKELESLVFVKLETNRIGFWDKQYRLSGTEERGILRSNKRDYQYKLGEMICLDGFWKSFTDPRE